MEDTSSYGTYVRVATARRKPGIHGAAAGEFTEATGDWTSDWRITLYLELLYTTHHSCVLCFMFVTSCSPSVVATCGLSHGYWCSSLLLLVL